MLSNFGSEGKTSLLYLTTQLCVAKRMLKPGAQCFSIRSMSEYAAVVDIDDQAADGSGIEYVSFTLSLGLKRFPTLSSRSTVI